MNRDRFMRLATLALSGLLATAPLANAQQSRVPDAGSDPAEVVLLESGLWRYADASGPRCTDIPHVGALCALPSVWAPFPGAPGDQRQLFFQDETFRASATSLTPMSADRPLTRDDVLRQMQARVTGSDGLMMAQQQGFATTAAGYDWVTTPFVGAGAFLISLTQINGRVVVVETKEFGTTMVSPTHRSAHQAFLDGLTLATNW